MYFVFFVIGYSLIPLLFMLLAIIQAKKGKSPKPFLIIQSVLTALITLGTFVGGTEDISAENATGLGVIWVLFVISVVFCSMKRKAKNKQK